MVYLEKAESEIFFIDMMTVNEFRQRNIYKNCQQLAHRSDQCSNPRVLSRKVSVQDQLRKCRWRQIPTLHLHVVVPLGLRPSDLIESFD